MTGPELADKIERVAKTYDEKADHLARLPRDCEPGHLRAAVVNRDIMHTALGATYDDHRALIVRALRALGEPDEAAVERAAEAAFLACQRRTQASRDRFPWTSIDIATRGYWRDFARAALKAARAADE